MSDQPTSLKEIKDFFDFAFYLKSDNAGVVVCACIQDDSGYASEKTWEVPERIFVKNAEGRVIPFALVRELSPQDSVILGPIQFPLYLVEEGAVICAESMMRIYFEPVQGRGYQSFELVIMSPA